jgi:hypothetical protein
MRQPQASLESTGDRCFACGTRIPPGDMAVYLYGAWFHLPCYQHDNNLPAEPTAIPPAVGHASARSWPVQRVVSWMTDPGPRLSAGRAHAKDPVAVELGRRGGLKGGKARAARLSPKRRAAIARHAARARWAAARERAS